MLPQRTSCPSCGRPYDDPDVTCRPTGGDLLSWQCNLAEEQRRAAEREAIAHALLLRAMLEDGNKDQAGKLRGVLARGARVGESWSPTVPDPDGGEDGPELSAGTVRFDPPGVMIRRPDEKAWLDWVEQHYPARMVHQRASDGRREPSQAEADVLGAALAAAFPALSAGGFDPWGAAVAAFWQVLQNNGLHVARFEPVEERRIVNPEWQKALDGHLVKLARELAGDRGPMDIDPVDQSGLAVEGVTVTVGPPKLVVLPSHDRQTVDAYARQRLGGRTLEILPAVPTESENRSEQP